MRARHVEQQFTLGNVGAAAVPIINWPPHAGAGAGMRCTAAAIGNRPSVCAP
jgi:hypothetical protein